MMASKDKPESTLPEKSLSREERLVEAKVRAAKRAMLFETLWPRMWLPVAVCGVFVLLSAFEVWQLLPPRFHLSLLGLFGGALVLSLLPLVLWKRPTREKSIARIEQASALEHRPLTAYNDTLSHEARFSGNRRPMAGASRPRRKVARQTEGWSAPVRASIATIHLRCARFLS